MFLIYFYNKTLTPQEFSMTSLQNVRIFTEAELCLLLIKNYENFS